MRANRRLSSLVRTPVALAAAVLAMLLAFVMPTVATAQTGYPPGQFTLTLSLSTVPPGGAFTATVNGCTVGGEVALSIDGTVIAGQATCGAAGAAGFMRAGVAGAARPAGAAGGTIVASVNAPATPGSYTVRAVELTGEQRTATAVLTVTAPTAPTATTLPTGNLPSTGSDVMRIAVGATAVLAVGFGAVLLSRRRRHPTAI